MINSSQAADAVALSADLRARFAAPPSRQRSFTYGLGSWLRNAESLAGVREVLESLPPAIDRTEAARRVETLLETNPAGAFVVAMVWGHGSTGYGPYRTAC